MLKKGFRKKVVCGTCLGLTLLVSNVFAKTATVINPIPHRASIHNQKITDRTYLDNVEAALDIHNFVQSRINARLLEHDSTENARVDNVLNEKRSTICDECNEKLLSPYMKNSSAVWSKMKENMDEGYEEMSAQAETATGQLSTKIEDYLDIWDMGHEVLMDLYEDMDGWEGGLPQRKHYSFKLWRVQETLYDDLEWDPKYTKINKEIAADIGTTCIVVKEDRHEKGDRTIPYPEFDATYYSGAHYDYYHHDGEFMKAHNDYLTQIETDYANAWNSMYDNEYERVYEATFKEIEYIDCEVTCPGPWKCCNEPSENGETKTSCTEIKGCKNEKAVEDAKKEADRRALAKANGSCRACEKSTKEDTCEYKVPEKMRIEEKYIPIEQPRPLPPVEETVMSLDGKLYPEDPILWTYKGKDYKWSENGGTFNTEKGEGELQNNRLSRYVMLQEEKKMSKDLYELHQATDLLTIAEIINMKNDYGIDIKGEDGDLVYAGEELFLVKENAEEGEQGTENDQAENASGSGLASFTHDIYAENQFDSTQFDKMSALNKENLTEVKRRFLKAKEDQIKDALDKIEFFHVDTYDSKEVDRARQLIKALEKDKNAETLLTYNNPLDPLNYQYKDDAEKDVYTNFDNATEQYKALTEEMSGLINEHRKQLKEIWTAKIGKNKTDEKCLNEGMDGGFPEEREAIQNLENEIK